MGDNKEMIPDLDQLDKVLMMSSEEIIDSMAVESIMETETTADEDLCDIEDLIGEEGLKIIDRYKEDRRIKKEAEERDRKIEEAVSKITNTFKQNHSNDYKYDILKIWTDSIHLSSKLKRDSEPRRDIYDKWLKNIVEIQEFLKKVGGRREVIVNKAITEAKKEPERVNEIIQNTKKELYEVITEDEYNHMKALERKCHGYAKESHQFKKGPKYENGESNTIVATASFSEVEDITGLESVFETNLDAALTVGAVGTIGYWLYKNLIATKKKRNELGNNRFQNAYYYVLNNEFKKSERALNSLLKGRKRFIVSKAVLEEVVGFRKKYYNVVAMTANRFMDAYENLKDLIGKEKLYTFSDVNPVRDKSLIHKLNNSAKALYELKNGNFLQAASPILAYEVNYESSDTSKILVESNYLETILNPKETFRIIKELDSIIEKIPPYDSAERYDTLLVKESTPGPLNCYVSIMYELRDLAEKVLGIVNGYIYTVYSLLDYCVIANDKSKGSVMEATEGVVKNLKVAAIINQNNMAQKKFQTNSSKVEKNDPADQLKQFVETASTEIKKIKGNLLLKSKIAVLEKLHKDYVKFLKRNANTHPVALKDTTKSIFLASKHDTVNQLLPDMSFEKSFEFNNIVQDLRQIRDDIYDLTLKTEISDECREVLGTEFSYLKSIVDDNYTDLCYLNKDEAKILYHYFFMRYQLLKDFVVFSTLKE